MSEQEQILYMQTRLLQMAMERWHLPREKAVSVFRKYALASLIEDNFDLYHMEGDEAVYQDMISYLKTKGVFFGD